MKTIAIILISTFLLTNCSTNFENDYYRAKGILQDKKLSKLETYEYISGIKFPETSRLVTVVDSNFVTIAIVKFDKSYCSSLCSDNKFNPVKDTFPQTLLGQVYLDRSYSQLPNNSTLLRKRGKGNGTLWMYLLDTTNCILYCNFSYPDTQGNTKPIWFDPSQEQLSIDKEKFAKH